MYSTSLKMLVYKPQFFTKELCKSSEWPMKLIQYPSPGATNRKIELKVFIQSLRTSEVDVTRDVLN